MYLVYVAHVDEFNSYIYPIVMLNYIVLVVFLYSVDIIIWYSIQIQFCGGKVTFPQQYDVIMELPP